MKRRKHVAIFPTGIAGAEKLARRIEVIAQEVRYAEKPTDLQYPRWLLLKTSHELHLFMMEWIEARMHLKKTDRGQFPRL